jgi:hypothetical protein
MALHCQWGAFGNEEALPSWVMNDADEWTAAGTPDAAILVTVSDIAQVLNYKYKSLRYPMNLSH